MLTIIDSAMNGTAAAGGFAGASVWGRPAFRGARGVFSNEAGLQQRPQSPMRAARTNQPVQQGMIAMLGTFIDTLVICTMTGLAS